MLEQTIEYSEERGTWNLFVNGEWYYEGDYETGSDMMVNNQVDYYEEDSYDEPYPYEEEYWDDPCVAEGWAQQDVIDSYRRER